MRMLSLILFALGVAGLVLLQRVDPAPTLASDAAGLALANGRDILHVQTRHRMAAANGQASGSLRGELWLAPVTRDARYEHRGAGGEVETVYLRKGLTLHTWFPSGGSGILSSETYLNEDSPALGYAQNTVLSYQGALDSDAARVARTETVAGRQTKVLQHRRDAEGMRTVVKAWVEEATGLPLRRVTYEDRGIGGLKEMGRETVSYPVVEHIARAKAPMGLFAVPKAHIRIAQRYLVAAVGPIPVEFPAYWIGPTFGARSLYAAYTEETVNGDLPGLATSLHLVYTTDEEREGLQIHQRPASQAPPGCRVEGETLTVRGWRVEVCDYADRATTKSHLTIGETYLGVSADDRQQVVQVINALRPYGE